MFRKNKIYMVGILAVLVALMIVGCGVSTSEDGAAKSLSEEISSEEPVDVLPDEMKEFPIGFYIRTDNDQRVLQTQVQTDYVIGKDIVVLSAFLTEEPEISGAKFGNVWSSYRDALPKDVSYKIAYWLSYNLASGESVQQDIWGPLDTEENREYIETYIYDDVHQSGWYSHLLVSDVTAETVVTSIKLTGGPNIAEVENITVKAFLYRPEEPSLEWGSATVKIIKK